jgi:hypothetical protein
VNTPETKVEAAIGSVAFDDPDHLVERVTVAGHPPLPPRPSLVALQVALLPANRRCRADTTYVDPAWIRDSVLPRCT